MRFKVGEQPVPGYRLDAFLGAGSYGEVWKVVGPGGVPCAMKFISLDSKSGLKEFRSIGLVKKLQHPNLCPVQAIWLRDDEGNVLSDSDQNSITIRMLGPKELIIAMGLGRKTLAQRLEETRGRGIPPHELLRYMVDAARGIDYLNSPEHDLGSGPAAVIHCDIKPANLLIVGGGVQVCDYGVIRALGPDIVRKTFAAGTPAYAPPELINNEPCPQTDQYSLAITYYELRTGQLPFDETKAIVANLTGQLDLSLVAGNDEREVLRQALSLQPDRRFATCEEFVDTLRVAAGITLGRPPSGVHQMPTTRPTPGGGPGSSSGPFQQPGSDRQSWPQPTPFSDRPTPRITPTPLPPDSAEHRPLPQPPPAEPTLPRRSPIPADGTLQLDVQQDAVVNLAPGPAAPPRRTPAPEPLLPKGSGTFIDDDERPSRTGAFLPLAIGLVLVLGLVATGVYIFVIKPGTDTAATTTPTEPTPIGGTQPTGNGGGSSTKSTGETRPTPSVTQPTSSPSTGTKPTKDTTPIPPKDYSQELKKARAHFALADEDDGEVQKGLNALAPILTARLPASDTIGDAAQQLDTWWKNVQKVLAEPGTGPVRLYHRVPKPTTEHLRSEEDVTSANDYRGLKLAKLIAATIPELDEGVSWEDLGKACADARDDAVVRACRAECWAELPMKDKKYEAEAVPEALAGYPNYVAARLKQVNGAKAADVAVDLAEGFEKGVPPWSNPRRLKVAYAAFVEAAKSASNADAYRWLTIADRDAAAVKATDAERFDLRFRRLVAGWNDGAPNERLKPELKKLHQEVQRVEAERVKKLAPAEQFKFWLMLGSTFLDPTDGAERVRAYTKALTAAKEVKDLKVSDLRKQLLNVVTGDEFNMLAKGGEAADLYRQAGHAVRGNRAEWEAEQGAPDAMAYAAGLFNRAAAVTNAPEDLAWKGISLAEVKAPSAADVAAVAKALGEPKRTEIPVVKALRGVAGHLQEGAAARLSAHDQFREALEAIDGRPTDAGDVRAVVLRWGTANAWWLVANAYKGQPLPADLPKPTEQRADPPEAEAYYALATVERLRAATPPGEGLTRAIDLYKRAYAAGGPGGWAKAAATGLGDALVEDGKRMWDAGDLRGALLRFGETAPLTRPGSPVSATRKAWYEAITIFRGVRPKYEDLDAVIEPQAASAATIPPADRDALVRLLLLRSHSLTGAVEFVYPQALAGDASKTKRTGLAVAAAEKAVELARGLTPLLEAEARGTLGRAYFFDGLAKKPNDGKAAVALFGKAQAELGDAIRGAPRHDDAFTWKFGFGFCVLDNLVANNDLKNAPQLALGYSLLLEARADLIGARPGSEKAAAAGTVERNVAAWAPVLDGLPDDEGKDLVKLHELLDRAAAAANGGQEYKLTDEDNKLLEAVAEVAKKRDAPPMMSQALERIRKRFKPAG